MKRNEKFGRQGEGRATLLALPSPPLTPHLTRDESRMRGNQESLLGRSNSPTPFPELSRCRQNFLSLAFLPSSASATEFPVSLRSRID